MKRVGFIGWRGMVGSVLMDRMLAENDFNGFEPFFFSTSQAGQPGPDIGSAGPLVEDAFDLARLAEMDVIVSCQGGGYTEKTHPQLRRGHDPGPVGAVRAGGVGGGGGVRPPLRPGHPPAVLR